MMIIKNSKPCRRGAALMMTLIMLVVLSILVTGFVVSMRTELSASYSNENIQRTKMVAQGAMAHAVELLRSNIPDPAPITESHTTANQDNWLTNPGRLTVIPAGGGQPSFVDLHTGLAEGAAGEGGPDVSSFDLNAPLAGESAGAIVDDPGEGETPKMRAAWVNVLRDPTEPPGPENQVQGRYAFWMDDESTKINYNVAIGKPDPQEADPRPSSNGAGWYAQKQAGFTTPRWSFGDGLTTRSYHDPTTTGNPIRNWCLGHPGSINLDVLFEELSSFDPKPALLSLHNHTFFHGFHRFPEAILNYVDLDDDPGTIGPEERQWYDDNKWNLTFYSRSPEFNAFGKSRFFTTHIPISLEGGPSYQMPFTHNGILHFNSLMGNLFMSEGNLDGEANESANRVNEAQFSMLMEYMRRPWPGYGSSFVDKYGVEECAQIALNMLLSARLATCNIASKNPSFTNQYRYRLTSSNYSSNENEGTGTPENYYWRINSNGEVDPADPNATLMLPAVAGPFITEVEFRITVEKSDDGGSGRRRRSNSVLLCDYRTETYMQPMGSLIHEKRFQNRVDFLEIITNSHTQTIGKTGDNLFWNNLNNDREDGGGRRINSELNRLAINAMPKDLEPGAYQLSGRKKFWVADNEKIRPWRANRRDKGKAFAHRFDLRRTRGKTDVTVRWRLGLAVGKRPKQMIPLGVGENDVIEHTFADVDLTDYGSTYSVTWQIEDPRLSAHADKWIATEGSDTLGMKNDVPTSGGAGDRSKFKFVQRSENGHKIGSMSVDRGQEYNTATRVASKGYWSLISAGIQNGEAWRTLSMSPGQADPPDWLLLDLMGATYPMQQNQWNIDKTLPDTWSTISYMNSTAGQVNLNTKIYPDDPGTFNPPVRTKPLQAVFRHMRDNQAQEDGLVDAINAAQDGGDYFTYIGELAEVPGYAKGGNEWEREEILRNLAGLLTTKTNTFGLWGVAQTVKKNPRNDGYDRFEEGDGVLGQKRFFAIIERYIWPGKDGVPGNGHAGENGAWDRLAQKNKDIGAYEGVTNTISGLPGSPPLNRGKDEYGNWNNRLTLWRGGEYAVLDGPDEVKMEDPKQGALGETELKKALGKVKWERSDLEDAYNPPHALIKYRVAYFRYIE